MGCVATRCDQRIFVLIFLDGYDIKLGAMPVPDLPQ